MNLEEKEILRTNLIENQNLQSIKEEDFVEIIEEYEDLRHNPLIFLNMVDYLGPQIVEKYVPNGQIDIGDLDNPLFLSEFDEEGLKDLGIAFANQKLYRKVVSLGYDFDVSLKETNPRLARQIFVRDTFVKPEKWKDIPQEKWGEYIDFYYLNHNADFILDFAQLYGNDVLRYYSGSAENILKYKATHQLLTYKDLVNLKDLKIDVNDNGQNVPIFDYMAYNNNGWLDSQLNTEETKKEFLDLLEQAPNVRSDARFFKRLLEFMPEECVRLYDGVDEDLLNLKIERNYFTIKDLMNLRNAKLELNIDGKEYDYFEYTMYENSSSLENLLKSDEAKKELEEIIRNDTKGDLRKDKKFMSRVLDFLSPEIIEYYIPENDYSDRIYGGLVMMSSRDKHEEESYDPIKKAVEKGYKFDFFKTLENPELLNDSLIVQFVLKDKIWESLEYDENIEDNQLHQVLEKMPSRVICNSDLFLRLIKVNGFGVLPEYKGDYRDKFVDQIVELVKHGVKIYPKDLLIARELENNSDIQAQIIKDLCDEKDFNKIEEALNLNKETEDYLIGLPFLSKSDELFMHLLSMDNSLIRYYDGENDDIYTQALACGFKPELEDFNEYKGRMNKQNLIAMAYIEDAVESGKISTLTENDQDEKKKELFSDIRKSTLFEIDEVVKYLIQNVDPRYVEYYQGRHKDVIEFAFQNGYHFEGKLPQRIDLFVANDSFREEFIDKVLGDEKDKLSIQELLKLNSIIRIADKPEALAKIKGFFDPNIVSNLGVDNICKILKYSIEYKEIDEFIKLNSENKLEDFMKFYNLVDTNIENNRAMGIDKFIKSINLYIGYPLLSKQLIEKVESRENLTDEEVINLRFMLDNSKKSNRYREVNPNETFGLDDLRNLSSVRKEKFIEDFNGSKRLEDKKDAIFMYLLNKDLYDTDEMLNELINTMMLTYMIQDAKEAGIKEVEVEANYMYAIVNAIETLNEIDDPEKIDKFAKVLQRMQPNEIVPILKLFDNFEEKARMLYELEAQSQLTDIDGLKDNPDFCKETEFTYTSLESDEQKKYKAKIIDLSHSKHTVYSHVYTKHSAQDYFSHSEGRQVMCVSVQTDKNEDYYRGEKTKDAVKLIFSNLPTGNFLLSSVSNIGSNGSIYANDYDVDVSSQFTSSPIRENYTVNGDISNHSETLVYRDGMVPQGIGIYGEFPNEYEIKSKEEFEKEIEIVTGEKVELPFIRLQGMGNRVFEYRKKIESRMPRDINQESKDEEVEFCRKLFDLGSKTQIRKSQEYISSIEGTSNYEYEGYAIIDGTPYLIREIESEDDYCLHSKNLAAMKIQQLVYGKKQVNQLDVRTITQTENRSGKKEEVVYEAIKRESARSLLKYSRDDGRLGKTVYSEILKEFMVDHLLCNYVSNNEAFLLDEKQEIYGVNKEGAFNAVDDFIGKDGSLYTGMSFYYFDASKGNNLYRKVFEEFISSDGEEVFSEEDFENLRESSREISSMPDEEYLKNFEELLASYDSKNSEEKDKLVKTILARKNNLEQDTSEFIDRIENLRKIQKETEHFESLESIAIINDIHGNLSALESILEECKNSGRTDIFMLGDIIGFGRQSEECLDLLRKYSNQLNIRNLLGNHEMYCIMGDENFSRPHSEIMQSEDIRSNMSIENRRYIEEMPLDRRIQVGSKKVEFTHFPHFKSKRDGDIYGKHGSYHFEESTSGKDQDYLIYGHEHRTVNTDGDEVGTIYSQNVNGTEFINLPSSGCVHGNKTSYSVLYFDKDGNIVPQVVAIDYDRSKTIEAIDRNVENEGFDGSRFFGE